MSDALFESTKLAAYFLWEITGCGNALDLWYCAEDMACYFERECIQHNDQVTAILRLGVHDPDYVSFVRHVAYRIFVYTNRTDAATNWFAAEKLLTIREWVNAVTAMAVIYGNEKNNHAVMSGVRSENVRAYYTK